MAGRNNKAGGGRSGGGAVAEAKAAPAKAFSSPGTEFDSMKRRYDRTRPVSGGLYSDTSDRPKTWGRNTKQLQAGLTRDRARKIYRAQASRPLNELTRDQIKAPAGRFSTYRNPAPAKSFPMQAPGRTKAGVAMARAGREAAGTSRRRRKASA